jgi:hypothetical protein
MDSNFESSLDLSEDYDYIFKGAKYQSPDQIKAERIKLYKNLSKNKMVITP